MSLGQMLKAKGANLPYQRTMNKSPGGMPQFERIANATERTRKE